MKSRNDFENKKLSIGNLRTIQKQCRLHFGRDLQFSSSFDLYNLKTKYVYMQHTETNIFSTTPAFKLSYEFKRFASDAQEFCLNFNSEEFHLAKKRLDSVPRTQ
jgi:hypothetical protein